MPCVSAGSAGWRYVCGGLCIWTTGFFFGLRGANISWSQLSLFKTCVPGGLQATEDLEVLSPGQADGPPSSALQVTPTAAASSSTSGATSASAAAATPDGSGSLPPSQALTAAWEEGLFRYFRPTLSWSEFSTPMRFAEWIPKGSDRVFSPPQIVLDDTVDADLLARAAAPDAGPNAKKNSSFLALRARLANAVGEKRLSKLPAGSLYAFPVTNERSVALAHRFVELTSAQYSPKIPNPAKSRYGMRTFACWVNNSGFTNGGCVVELNSAMEKIQGYLETGKPVGIAAMKTRLFSFEGNKPPRGNRLLDQMQPEKEAKMTYLAVRSAESEKEGKEKPAGASGGGGPAAKTENPAADSASPTSSKPSTGPAAAEPKPNTPAPSTSTTPLALFAKLKKEDPSQYARFASKFFQVATKTNTDKIRSHRYQDLYGRYLPEKFTDDALRRKRFLEIGLGCTMAYGPGASATIWVNMGFTNVHFLEFDSNCVAKYASQIRKEGYNVYTGSQESLHRLETLKHELKYDAEIIIDDGGHMNRQMLSSFYALWPIVRNGGYYIVEDWAETAYIPGYLDAPRVAVAGAEAPGTLQWEVGVMLRHMFCRTLGTSCFAGLVFVDVQFNHVLFRKAA